MCTCGLTYLQRVSRYHQSAVVFPPEGVELKVSFASSGYLQHIGEITIRSVFSHTNTISHSDNDLSGEPQQDHETEILTSAVSCVADSTSYQLNRLNCEVYIACCLQVSHRKFTISNCCFYIYRWLWADMAFLRC